MGMMDTIYDASGIGDGAMAGLEQARVRIALARGGWAQLVTPHGIPSVPRDDWPEPPQVRMPDGSAAGLHLTDTGCVLQHMVAGSHMHTGQVGTGILRDTPPELLLELTRAAEAYADTAEALRDERARAVEQAIEDALQAADPALRELAQYAVGARDAEAERLQWISEHGSQRLRRCVSEGIECGAIYRDERLAAELTGYRWDDIDLPDWDEPRNPPERAFALLDAARASAGDLADNVELQFCTLEPETDECGEPECEEYRGYVALVSVPWAGDRDAVYLPEDWPESGAHFRGVVD
jgi:hypothetical protein